MKFGKWARLLPGLLLVLTPFLEGCGDFWQNPGTTGSGGGTTSTTLSSGVFYVLNSLTNYEIVAYQINSGSLTTIDSYTLSAEPYAIAIAPGNGFLYVSTLAGIFLYTIESSGALKIGNGGSAISTDIAQAIQVNTNGTWLVDAETGTSGVIVNAISINPNTGALNSNVEESQSYVVANPSVGKMALSGDDLNVFLTVGTGGTLVIPFNSGNGNPLAATAKVITPVVSGATALSVAVDPVTSTTTTPRLFYIGETEASSDSGGLRAFEYSSLSSGGVTEIAGSPYAAGGLAPAAILPDPTGSYVYVASGQGTSNGVIQGFNIASNTSGSTTTYTLSSISTVSTGILPEGLAEDSDSNFVLAVSSGGSYDLEAYIFDTTTAGKLDDSINSTTGTDPTGAVAVAALAP
jgi:6-phosphogluconolactonase